MQRNVGLGGCLAKLYGVAVIRSLTSAEREAAASVATGSACLNQHGDHGRLLPGIKGYGTDISFDRLDDLDLAAISFARLLPDRRPGSRPVAVDIGCGYGRIAIEMASVGIDVFAIDLADTGEWMQQFLARRVAERRLTNVGTIQFVRGDATKIDLGVIDRPISIIYTQRFLHYIRYRDALNMFSALRQKVSNSSAAFVGVSGLNSPLGRGYGQAGLAIQDRFCRLNADDNEVEKHDISAPVCLYTRAELGTLMESSGFRIEELYESGFGNIKGRFSPN